MGKNVNINSSEVFFGKKRSENDTKDILTQVQDPVAGYGSVLELTHQLTSTPAAELADLAIPGDYIRRLENAIDMDAVQLAKILGMSKSKYYRVIKEEFLDLDEIDVLSSFLKIWKKGIGAFDFYADDFEEFLNTTNINLGGIKPLSLLTTENGRREVEKALDRIEYSTYG